MLAACGEGPPAALVDCVVESDLDAGQQSVLIGQGFYARQTE